MDGYICQKQVPSTSTTKFYAGTTRYMVHGYMYRGTLHCMDHSEEGVKNAIKNFEKARIILSMLDLISGPQDWNVILCLRGPSWPVLERIKNNSDILQENHHNNIGKFGATSVSAIQSGLACLLHMEDVFEAERLSMKLAADRRQAHGPDHSCTKLAVESLNFRKRRYVAIPPDTKLFLALRYEDDGEICVLKGPMAEPRRR